jgi:hypothetical protein
MSGFLLALLSILIASCINPPEAALTQLIESRRLAADLVVQFTKAADASNRAVMADTDDASTAFANEAKQATEAAQKNVDSLRPILNNLEFTNEARLLDDFNSRFAAYRKADAEILSLAVENTNLKAQRLSFGPASEAVDAFRRAVEATAAAAATKDQWQAKALSATAIAAVREIQVRQAPHIAEAKDAAMTEIEKQMTASEADARRALRNLEALAPATRQELTAAHTALDRFMEVNAQIVALSRRNTNVRSLALALGQKRTLTASCDEDLRALQDALAQRDFKATR